MFALLTPVKHLPITRNCLVTCLSIKMSSQLSHVLSISKVNRYVSTVMVLFQYSSFIIYDRKRSNLVCGSHLEAAGIMSSLLSPLLPSSSRPRRQTAHSPSTLEAPVRQSLLQCPFTVCSECILLQAQLFKLIISFIANPEAVHRQLIPEEG